MLPIHLSLCPFLKQGSPKLLMPLQLLNNYPREVPIESSQTILSTINF